MIMGYLKHLVNLNCHGWPRAMFGKNLSDPNGSTQGQWMKDGEVKFLVVWYTWLLSIEDCSLYVREKNRIKGGSATSKDEWLDGVKQLKMETNWHWHCTLRMFKQHTCRSNQGQVHSSGDCSNGGSRFFLSKNGDFPLPLCHDGSTDVYFGWVQKV